MYGVGALVVRYHIYCGTLMNTGCGVLLCAVYAGAGSFNPTHGCTRVLYSHYFTILGWVQPICRRDEGKLSAS